MKAQKSQAAALSSLLGILLATAPMQALAVATNDNCTEKVGGFLGFPTWYKYLHPTITSAGECTLQFDIKEDLPKVLLAVFEIILRVGGLIAVGFIVYGGFQYMISQGNPDQTKAARGTILNAIIGLVITMSAVAIVNLIGKNL